MNSGRLLWLGLIAGAAACGRVDAGNDAEAKPGGTGLTVTGSLPFSASSFVAANGGATCLLGGASTGIAYAAIVATAVSGACGDLQQGLSRANARSVDLVVVRVDSGGTATGIPVGAYPVVTVPGSQGTFAMVQVSQNDAHCAQSHLAAIAGSVQVTSVAGGEVRGTVVATLSDGGVITGAFDAPACAVAFPGDACSGQVGPAGSTCAP